MGAKHCADRFPRAGFLAGRMIQEYDDAVPQVGNGINGMGGGLLFLLVANPIMMHPAPCALRCRPTTFLGHSSHRKFAPYVMIFSLASGRSVK